MKFKKRAAVEAAARSKDCFARNEKLNNISIRGFVSIFPGMK
jgi:hypothetical protein